MTSLEKIYAYAIALVGRRVCVHTYRQHGSTVRLHGLTGTVLCLHPIATGWVKLRLDPTDKVDCLEWPITADCLILL